MFKSRRTNQNFVEAHHLYPVSATKLLGRNLDFGDNIFALCPGCHRAIHYGVNEAANQIINNLYELRSDIFNGHNLHYDDLLTIYSVEQIESH